MSLNSTIERSRISRSQIITTLIGLTISGVLIYFSLRGIDFGLFGAGLKGANYLYVLAAAITVILLMWGSWRWGGILEPIKKVDQKTLFPISCVGYMAIAVFPFRIGELIRPVLINRKVPAIPLVSGFSSVIVERIFDALVLTIILLASIAVLPLPQWLVVSTIIVLAGSFILLIIMILIAFNTEKSIKLLSPLFHLLPEKFHKRGIKLIQDLSNGFKVISTVKRFTLVMFQSIAVWIIAAATIYLLFKALNLTLPVTAIIVTLSLNGLGVMLPAAPGFVGNFEFSVILALSIFDVSKSNALVFAVIYHVLGIGLNILLGLVFLPFTNFSVKHLKPLQD